MLSILINYQSINWFCLTFPSHDYHFEAYTSPYLPRFDDLAWAIHYLQCGEVSLGLGRWLTEPTTAEIDILSMIQTFTEDQVGEETIRGMLQGIRRRIIDSYRSAMTDEDELLVGIFFKYRFMLWGESQCPDII